MLARLTAFAVWALVAATVVFWGLRMVVQPQAVPAFAVPVGDSAALRGDLSRLLGATATAPSAAPAAAAPELASRFKLLGVMASPQHEGAGYALIAVDAKPARAYPVGASLDGDIVLQSVSLRSAAIGPARGGAALTLEVPPLPAAATGTLPPATEGLRYGAGAAPAQPSPPPAAITPARPGPAASAPPGQTPRNRVQGAASR
jgi:general secretion pathway protein C